MKLLKIGLIREGKIPPDKRVALTPNQCKYLEEKYPGISFFCQPSDSRSFSNEEFEKSGVTVTEDITDCDILFGIKEVPVEQLIPAKTYFFFSHTLKKQPYNRRLLQEVINKKITLIDYEAITDQTGERLVAFGRYAGIVGAYNAFRTIGLKYNIVNLPPAYTLFDKREMILWLKKFTFPPLKIVLTGNGRVAKGVKEVLDEIGTRQVSVKEFLSSEYNEMVYSIPSSGDYHIKADETFSKEDFYLNPSGYVSTFAEFTKKADVLIASAYWNPSAPKLFSIDDVKHPDFRIRIIADITCDLNGSIPTTKRSSTIYDPFYDYNKHSDSIDAPFSARDNVTVMAIDNLPTELPRDASEFFGEQLINYVFPALIENNKKEIIENSILAKEGSLTEKFSYLGDYLKGL
jgi:saccharopine dehydrogenase (NAD+, L-lysine forming)